MPNAIEAALAAIPADCDELIAAKCRALMRGYDAHWSVAMLCDAAWVTESTEETFHLPIINPETGAPSRTFTHAGKYDGVIRYCGKPWLLEHKTTSESIEDPNATYWRKLVIDGQVSGYTLANWQDGRKVEGTVYDVIRKPTIRPKAITKADQKGIVSLGVYHGREVPDALREAVAHGQDHECPALYELRLTRDVLETPEAYFQRRPIPRLDSELLEYAGELWDVSKTIIEARAHNRHYRNPASCVTYSTPCEYLPICSGCDSPESQNWRRVENVHEELDGIEGDGRSILTNSRVRCFQTCRRKHQLRYELGVRRAVDEDREPLVFGKVLHEALRAWWDCYRAVESRADKRESVLF